MTIKEARKQAMNFMQKSGKLVDWHQIKIAEQSNKSIMIDGIAYNIDGYKKITL